MSFVAKAERTIAVPPEKAFDRLADFSSWGEWMPPSFRPVGAGGPLKVGDKPRVRIGGAPFATALEVTVVDRAREITWCGGTRGVLWAEHRFLFEPDGNGGTRVSSVETWSGSLAAISKLAVVPVAERIGRQQLDALANAVGG